MTVDCLVVAPLWVERHALFQRTAHEQAKSLSDIPPGVRLSKALQYRIDFGWERDGAVWTALTQLQFGCTRRSHDWRHNLLSASAMVALASAFACRRPSLYPLTSRVRPSPASPRALSFSRRMRRRASLTLPSVCSPAKFRSCCMRSWSTVAFRTANVPPCSFRRCAMGESWWSHTKFAMSSAARRSAPRRVTVFVIGSRGRWASACSPSSPLTADVSRSSSLGAALKGSGRCGLPRPGGSATGVSW